MDDNYKASKEAFVAGMTGSSIGHINMISLAALVSNGSNVSPKPQLTATRYPSRYTLRLGHVFHPADHFSSWEKLYFLLYPSSCP